MSLDIDTTRIDWHKRDFSCGLWIDPPGQVWANFVHGTDELVMLTEGEIELQFSGQILRPVIGEEILIPAGVSHTVINIGNTVNRWLYGYKNIE